MPTYAYACKSCGNAFDAVQAFSDPSLTECPACGGPLRKVYGSIGVTFNGAGFYRTDSRGSTSTAPSSPSGSESASSGAGAGASGASASSSSTGAAAPAPAAS